MPPSRHFHLNLQAYLIAGLLTITPMIAVWLVFDFLLGVLYQAGHPLAAGLADFIEDRAPAVKPLLDDYRVHWLIAIFVALLVLYAIGAIASRVIGVRLLAMFERVIARIPLVESIYSATKKLVGVLQQKPEGASRVVLVEFPHPGLRAIGLVMKTFRDATTGEELVAVFVPTAPNPTSGYLEIAAASKLTPTDMTIDQAMTMILSGGAMAPDHMSLGQATPTRDSTLSTKMG
jgi:uncharacterized membrane protein